MFRLIGILSLNFDILSLPQVLKNAILYLVLAPYDNEQSDLIHRVKLDKNLEEMPVYR